ncbi:hypothetical protein MMC29_003972 [Sticta canariensis]|nr:hypothetical protein [Sticta canariensis]
MSCSLLSLPVELHLKIIEALLRDKDIEAHEEKQDDEAHEEEQDDEAHEEKQDELININHDLIKWSCTCSYFRNLLAPTIFKTAKLVNDEKSGSSLNAVAKSPHNVHVKDLHFIGSALGDAHSEEAAFSDTEGILPRSVDALLCNLQWFPSLERLSIRFDYNFESMDDWVEGLDLLAEPETPQQVLEFEASAAWRALMSRTFYALTKNKPPNFKHLEIRQLHSKNVSTFSNAAFHECLNHFEHLTLSIHGEDNGAGWKSNTTQEYPALMEKLDEYFFNHLANVTILSIKAPKEGPLGLEGMNHVPLALKPDQMPLLATLHLGYIFASPELIDFLVGHKDTLEELVLCNCYASTNTYSGLAINGVYWSQLFTSLFSADPTQLRRLELVEGDMCLLDYEGFTEEQYEEVLTVHRQDPERIALPYAYLDDKYGMLFYDEEESLAAFVGGEDQRSWDRLMELVERNVKEATKRERKSVELQVQ